MKRDDFRRILEDLGITHVVDPLYEVPIHGSFRYYRLHGSRKGRKIVYSYKYLEEDLLKLLEYLRKYATEVNYVLFNNSYFSLDSAKSFKSLLGSQLK